MLLLMMMRVNDLNYLLSEVSTFIFVRLDVSLKRCWTSHKS